MSKTVRVNGNATLLRLIFIKPLLLLRRRRRLLLPPSVTFIRFLKLKCYGGVHKRRCGGGFASIDCQIDCTEKDGDWKRWQRCEKAANRIRARLNESAGEARAAHIDGHHRE